MPEIIQIELISQQHNNSQAGDFSINKTRELIDRKYYCPSFRKDVKSYVKSCDICLGLKVVKHKLYGSFQSLPMPINQ